MPGRLLLVDDAAIIRLKLKNILTAAGYEVAGEAGNGNEGVAKFKELKPDLVTLDIIMPEKDGLEALEEILSINPKARVIMVTGIDQRESIMKAIKLGALEYIVKPFESAKVLEVVARAVNFPT